MPTVNPSNLGEIDYNHEWGANFELGEQIGEVVYVDEYEKDGNERWQVVFGLPPVQGNDKGAKASWRMGFVGQRAATCLRALIPDMVREDAPEFDLQKRHVMGKRAILTVGERWYEGKRYPEIEDIRAVGSALAETATASDDDIGF